MMKTIDYLFGLFVICAITACNSNSSSEENIERFSEEKETVITDEQIDFLGITNKEHLSAASKKGFEMAARFGQRMVY